MGASNLACPTIQHFRDALASTAAPPCGLIPNLASSWNASGASATVEISSSRGASVNREFRMGHFTAATVACWKAAP